MKRFSLLCERPFHWKVMGRGWNRKKPPRRYMFWGGSQGGSWESGKRGGKPCSALGERKGGAFAWVEGAWGYECTVLVSTCVLPRDLGCLLCDYHAGEQQEIPASGLAAIRFLQGVFTLAKLCPYFSSNHKAWVCVLHCRTTTWSLGEWMCGERLQKLWSVPGKRDE